MKLQTAVKKVPVVMKYSRPTGSGLESSYGDEALQELQGVDWNPQTREQPGRPSFGLPPTITAFEVVQTLQGFGGFCLQFRVSLSATNPPSLASMKKRIVGQAF